MKKREFAPIYNAIEEYEGRVILYNDKGEYSTTLSISNPIERYSSDPELYYQFNNTIIDLIRALGSGYIIQKHDIFSRRSYSPPPADSFLQQSSNNYFEGRIYTEIRTYLTITQEKKGSPWRFNKKLWTNFLSKVSKAVSLLKDRGFHPRYLNKEEMTKLIYRYSCMNFQDESFSTENIKCNDENMKIGSKLVKCVSLIDIERLDLPNSIAPFTLVSSSSSSSDRPIDILSFLPDTPEVDNIIYNQSIFIPSQRKEYQLLEKKINRFSSLPSASNKISADSVRSAQTDIEKENKLLIYTHFSVIFSAPKNLIPALHFFDNQLSRSGIQASTQSYNQLELFRASFFGNASKVSPKYDRFLTTEDIAGCLMYKEKDSYDEDSDLKVYYTNRRGIPKGIDITGKEGKKKLTTNSNFFCLGPSGTGKSFHMNSVVRQLYEKNTDIILIDTGHSYDGLCEFLNGKYISYSEETPISMNPFKIKETEYNLEKLNFLKSLVFVLWKGTSGEVSPLEEEFITRVIESYYRFFFHPFHGFSDEEREERIQTLAIEYKARHNREGRYMSERISKLENMIALGEGNEQEVARGLLNKIHNKYSIPDSVLALIDDDINREEEELSNISVRELNFNSFYEFCLSYIPYLSRRDNIPFDIDQYKFLLSRFYKGGAMDRVLNEDFDTSLFDERLIVFDIDNIKDDKKLFPIVTLVIMDSFIQKMRLKPNRKALIIEEAWKAIASDMMAEYILYLYKTVRKHWGIIGVVTQEVEDIVSSPVVKKSILNNSEITILLDQEKLKDRFSEIQSLLGLTDVECNKIWTINKLDNKENRGPFKEVYIRRGSFGEVYGVEESPEAYMAYTTERAEKEALKIYKEKWGCITSAITHFLSDQKESGLSINEFSVSVCNG